MKDELYEKLLSKEEYFTLWARKNTFQLTQEISEQIYAKYLVKFEVYTRDNFTCQNVNCARKCDVLTIHHIKAQRNGGEDKPRNLLTLCDVCHKGYERAKQPITLSNNPKLPPHIQGRTFKLLRSGNNNARWKKIKKLLKKFRKVLRKEGLKITLQEYLESKNVEDDLQQVLMLIERKY